VEISSFKNRFARLVSSAVYLNSGLTCSFHSKFPWGNKLSVDHRAKILEAVTSCSCGVKEVIRKVKGRRASDTLSLVKEMNQERLIELKQTKSRRGRPKTRIFPTSLGIDFLESYLRLKAKPLRSRKQDLERAKRDAKYAERLVANGHDPFKLLLELNTIANNIKESAEAS